ncbi:MAG: prepilin-type N-terminal cleavage/methylation domain-containing protein [Pirellulaceae bacterium]
MFFLPLTVKPRQSRHAGVDTRPGFLRCSSRSSRRPPVVDFRSRRGLTLMELVVVLAILAAVTTAAVVATERVLVRRRAEITSATLDAFRRSLLGRYGQAESITTVSSNGNGPTIDGFIADMGRLPVAVGNDPSTQLAELWSNPAGVSAYGLKTAAGDAEVTLSCGWRGPYLDLPIGGHRLIDGFGRDMLVLSADGAGTPQIASAGQTVLGLTSLGSDGQVGIVDTEFPLAEDTTVWLGDSTSLFASDLSVRVYERDGGEGRMAPSQAGSLMVRLYLPDATTGDITFQQSPLLTTPASATLSFPDVPIGEKVLRAYWVSADSNSSVSSSVEPIEVRRGGEASFELYLPPLPIP